MAVLKRKVNSEAKGFSPYAGEDPRPGVYRARIIKASIREASTGRLSYNTFYELAAVKPDHKKYDGYTGFCEIYLGDETEEWAQAGESAFVKAITGKSNFQTANVAFTGKEEDFATGSGAPMTAIDGVKIENKIVNVNLRMEKERTHEGTTYPAELRARGILPWAKSEADDDEDDIDVDEADIEEGEEDGIDEQDLADQEEAEEGEELSDEEWEAAKEARRTELKSRAFGLDKLKEALTNNGVDVKGMKKPEMVEALIALEFPEDGEDEDGEDEDDAITESEIESDEDEDEDEEEEDEEEEDEEEDEEDVDLEAEIRAEAAELDRTALKKEIKALDEAAGFKKSETDDDLRERLVELKLAKAAF